MLKSTLASSLLALLLLCGCSGTSPNASSSSLSTSPQLSITPASFAFSSTSIGATSNTQIFTLTNTGTAALVISAVTLSDTSNFVLTSTCAASVAASSTCTLSASFKPQAAISYSATISIADNISGSPQIISLTGTGSGTALPQATLNPSTIAFPSTTAGTVSSAQTATLSNTGTATLAISSITLGGASPTAFAKSTTCGSTLAPSANCTISLTFAPASAATYSASLTVADNAANSPQSITLTGSGTGSSTPPATGVTLYTFPEADNSVTPLYALVNNAKTSIDLVMYALQDTTFTADLVAACKRGVTVRVILDQNSEKSADTPAFNSLNAQAGCSAVWANQAFQVTHQKTLIIDGTQTAIMSLNLQSQYYSTTRDFAFVESDTADIAAIQTTFNADYAAGTTASGTVGASDYTFIPPTGDDLIWSPTTAQAAMTNIIANAKSTLLIENEELASSASYIISALTTACSKGVIVHLAMVDQSSYEANFKTLEAAGCGVHVYPNTTTGFYVHAKAVVADYGLPSQSVYMGSINYSNASMTQNRELGLYITDPASVQSLYTTMSADYAGGSPY